MKIRFPILLIAVIGSMVSSCKKEYSQNVTDSRIEWMRVLIDTIESSTDDELYLGENGKVVTNSNNEIILYYFLKEINQTVLMKCNEEGNLVWKKVIENYIPCDMVLLKEGSIVLAGTHPDKINTPWTKLYALRPSGETDSLYFSPPYYLDMKSTVNVNLYALPDDGIILSGAFDGLNLPPHIYTVFVKISPAFTMEWRVNRLSGLNQPEFFGQSSIIQTDNNQYLYQIAQSVPELYVDSCYFSLKTGLLNANGSSASFTNYPTGYFITSTGQKSGHQNRYCGNLMRDGSSGFIYHYSSPRVFGNSTPNIPSGFLRIGSDAIIKDTIPIPLPDGYRIVSCIQNNGRFLMTAYKTGIVQGTGDFSANQTLFLSGGTDWQTSNTFTLQNFYADFFNSAAPVSDGGFVLMGKIQSFNKKSNKLVLIKLRP